MKFEEYVNESLKLDEKFEIGKFIAACKAMVSEYKKSDNKEGVKFLEDILSTYEKDGKLHPNSVSAASKWLNP